MSVEIYQSYRYLYFSDLYCFRGAPSGNFPEKISSSNYTPGFDDINNCLLYYVDDKDELRSIHSALASEVKRFSFCLYETLLSLHASKNDKSMPWQFIKIYYAAFYASQIIMRLTGKWPSRLVELDKYKQIYEIYNRKSLDIDLKGNLFLCHYDGEEKFICQLIQEKSNSSHKDTWSCFAKSLDFSLERLTNLSGLISNGVIGELISLKNDLGKEFSFLSDVRNSINYKSELGIWYPRDKDAKRDWNIYSSILDVKLEVYEPPNYFSRSNSRAQKYLTSCRFIIDLALWMMRDISNTKDKNKFLLTETKRLVSYISGL